MTYYDKLDAFFNGLKDSPMNAAAQLIYLHLLHRIDQKRCEIEVTDRELMELTGLPKQVVTDAKRRLKSKGLIDFKTDRANPRAGTIYRLNTPIVDINAEVRRQWIACASEEPNTATREELLKMEQEYGASQVAAAIRRAHFNKCYDYINLFMVKRQLVGGKSGKVERSTEPVRYTEETRMPSGEGGEIE